MLLNLYVGETGSGKSTMAKRAIQKESHVIVYDVQNEYGLPYFKKDNQLRGKFALSPIDFKFPQFVKFVTHAKGYHFVIEEATGIFYSKVGQEFIDAVLGKRHTGNTFHIIFHSLNRIPIRIYEFADRIYLFKTNDLEKNVKSKYPDMLEDFHKLQKAPKYACKIFNQSNLVK